MPQQRQRLVRVHDWPLDHGAQDGADMDGGEVNGTRAEGCPCLDGLTRPARWRQKICVLLRQARLAGGKDDDLTDRHTRVCGSRLGIAGMLAGHTDVCDTCVPALFCWLTGGRSAGGWRVKNSENGSL